MLDLQTLLAALDPQAPCGLALGQDQLFFELRQQIALEDRPDQEECNWSQVRELALDLLTRSKDLRVAVYLVLAHLELEGLNEIGRGLQFLSALLETFPQTLHPRPRQGRKKGQRQALQWFVEKSSQRLRSGNQGPIGAFALQQLDILERACQRVLGPDAPTLSELRRELRGRRNIASVQSPPNKGQPHSSPSAHAPQGEATAPEARRPQSNPERSDAIARSPKLDDPSSHPCALQTLGRHAIRLAHAMRQADFRDPRPYRLLRQSLWLPLRGAPQADEQGHFNLPFLRPLQLSQLQEQQTRGQWPGLLHASESLLVAHPVSLDLHYFAVLALKGLGDTNLSQSAITDEVVALLRRMPELLDIRSREGVGLASSACQLWIETQGAAMLPQRPPNNDEASSATWWQAIAKLPLIEREERLAQLQGALHAAPDRVEYARRALFAAQKWPQEAGLARILTHLAHHSLRGPSEKPVQRELEGRCLRALLRDRGPQPCALALELAKRDLAAALPYFR